MLIIICDTVSLLHPWQLGCSTFAKDLLSLLQKSFVKKIKMIKHITYIMWYMRLSVIVKD